MQDCRTGRMVEFDEEVMANVPKQDFKKRIADLMRTPGFREAGEAVGIPSEHQGPVFRIDEELEIKGGRFKVRGFEGGMLHLQGLPKAAR